MPVKVQQEVHNGLTNTLFHVYAKTARRTKVAHQITALTYWLIMMMAMSSLLVNSLNASSIALTDVSAATLDLVNRKQQQKCVMLRQTPTFCNN